jgi:transposase-like protein
MHFSARRWLAAAGRYEEKRRRHRFTAGYEGEAVSRLRESGETSRAVAGEPGVHADLPRTWRDECLAAGPAKAPARQEAGAAGLARLRREVGRFGQEDGILKRAAARSADPPERAAELTSREGRPMFLPCPGLVEALDRRQASPARSTVAPPGTVPDELAVHWTEPNW